MQREYRGSNILKGSESEIKIDYYLLTNQKILLDDLKPRYTYGIEIIENDIEKEYVEDVSVNQKIVINMIDKIRENGVLPVHLHDVIEDLL